jgi:hypothetical protein
MARHLAEADKHLAIRCVIDKAWMTLYCDTTAKSDEPLFTLEDCKQR